MRLNILAFAAGILCLQLQSTLPGWEPWLAAGLLMALPGTVWRNRPVRILALLACVAIGISWAGWRAETRLADQLGAEWEGRDIDVVGVIAGLPQAFAGGTRFAFDVSDAQAGAIVPGRIMLSWYRGRHAGEADDVPKGIAIPKWNVYASESARHINALKIAPKKSQPTSP